MILLEITLAITDSHYYGIADAYSFPTEHFYCFPFGKADTLIMSLGLLFVSCRLQSPYYKIIFEMFLFESVSLVDVV